MSVPLEPLKRTRARVKGRVATQGVSPLMEVGEVLAGSVNDGPGDALVVGRLLGCFHVCSIVGEGVCVKRNPRKPTGFR